MKLCIKRRFFLIISDTFASCHFKITVAMFSWHNSNCRLRSADTVRNICNIVSILGVDFLLETKNVSIWNWLVNCKANQNRTNSRYFRAGLQSYFAEREGIQITVLPVRVVISEWNSYAVLLRVACENEFYRLSFMKDFTFARVGDFCAFYKYIIALRQLASVWLHKLQ